MDLLDLLDLNVIFVILILDQHAAGHPDGDLVWLQGLLGQGHATAGDAVGRYALGQELHTACHITHAGVVR